MLDGLDLFSGIGGISLSLREWVRPIAYCEFDPYCQGVLLSQMANGNLWVAPIWDDVCSLGKESGQLPSDVIDIIYGGFPCQDISTCGTGKGLAGQRSGLFYEIVRLAKEIKPQYVFIENVPAITCRGGLEVVREIASLGYDCRWCVISAASIGAPHKRERWFLLANANNRLCQPENEKICSRRNEFNISNSKSAYAQSIRMQEGRNSKRIEEGQSFTMVSSLRSYWEETECPFCGVDDGIPYRVDRIKGLGNAVVPQQAKEAFKILMGLK
jgi:DNA (cytosine-5)-methyltransferase 1